MLNFQNRALNIRLLRFHINRNNSTYLKNVIFNKSSFSNSKIAIEFVALKRVHNRSQILIQVSVGLTHKMRQTLTVDFTYYLKKYDFLQMTSNIDKLYTVGNNFLSQI